MKIVVEYQGKQYESKVNNDYSAEEVAEMFYKNLEDTTKLKLELASGGFVIFGKSVVQSAAIAFLP